ncbi:hypothetical protein PBY51_009332 [Eleginops maclovinus]|uniref:Uncharacterized protein n=1 Tax=Eleginops maclovinus TaxID=56733 RepID=A0AAN7XWU3_ELEMC|nr:hypothetical protein PBY51_009332 [Eleginops maclovinus]
MVREVLFLLMEECEEQTKGAPPLAETVKTAAWSRLLLKCMVEFPEAERNHMLDLARWHLLDFLDTVKTNLSS